MKSTTTDPSPGQGSEHCLFWRLLPLAGIGVGFALFFAFDLDDYLTFEALGRHRQEIMDWTEANYVLAMLGFVGTYCVAVMLSIPGAVWMTLIGGFVFGTISGTICVVIGGTMGAIGIFLAARYAVGDFLRQRAGPAIKKMEKGFQENALSYLLILRLIPLFPFWLVNLVPAFLGVRLRTYILGTFFGIIPGSLVFASVGSGLSVVFDAGGTPDLGVIFMPEVALPIAGLVLLSLIPVVYKKVKARRA